MAPILRYPLQRIDRLSDFVKITAVTYKPPGLGASQNGQNGFFNIPNGSKVNGAGDPKSILGTIFLPIPEGLTDMNRTNWEGSNLNSLAGAAVRELGGLVSDLNLNDLRTDTLGTLSKAGNRLKTSAENALDGLDDKTRDVLKGALVAQAVNVFGANIDLNSITSRTEGVILNPNLELLFKGVDLRSFTFSFDLTPRSRAESDQIKAIINTFKRRMAPKTTVNGSGGSKGIFIGSPDVFDIEFRRGNQGHPFLFKMKTCALTNVQVNYAGTGAYATYEDSTPIKMRMTLSFRELNPIYQEDYNQFDLDDGVGF